MLSGSCAFRVDKCYDVAGKRRVDRVIKKGSVSRTPALGYNACRPRGEITMLCVVFMLHGVTRVYFSVSKSV